MTGDKGVGAGDDAGGGDAGADAEGRVVRRAPGWFAAVVIVAGGVTAAVVVGRPVGVGVTVVAWALLAAGALLARPREGWSAVWWIGAAALAGVATVRAAEWVVWPALVAAGGLASLAASGGKGWRQVAVGVLRIGRVQDGLLVVRSAASLPRARWRPALQGAGIGVVLLAVFVPLFAAADAAFAHLVGEVTPDPDLDRPVIRGAVWLGVIAVGGVLIGAGPEVKELSRAGRRLDRVAWVVPLAALVGLFAAFVALQVTTLYGGHDHVLRTAGLTYAEYAREGFAQLIAVAALTLAVVAGAARWAHDGWLLRTLLGALCLLTLVVLASALTRLDLYMDAYGFTRLRLTAEATILWLAAVFGLVLILRRGLPRGVVALTAGAVLLFAASDPDARIAERNVERYERTGRIDFGVLAQLSPDAAPALAALPPRLEACVTRRIRRTLRRDDGIAGLNLGRARARETLGPPAEPLCVAPGG